jgi:hypothetical protein
MVTALEQMEIAMLPRFHATLGELVVTVVSVEFVVASDEDRRMLIEPLLDDPAHTRDQALTHVAGDDDDVVGRSGIWQPERIGPVHVEMQIAENPSPHVRTPDWDARSTRSPKEASDHP